VDSCQARIGHNEPNFGRLALDWVVFAKAENILWLQIAVAAGFLLSVDVVLDVVQEFNGISYATQLLEKPLQISNPGALLDVVQCRAFVSSPVPEVSQVAMSSPRKDKEVAVVLDIVGNGSDQMSMAQISESLQDEELVSYGVTELVCR
jgi:hypothetical protein